MVAGVVGFTHLAEELTPKQVVSFLDSVFSRFDELTDKYALIRICIAMDCSFTSQLRPVRSSPA